eukprot:SAG31_NODE_1870_length_7027_cov_6.614319_1_plen_188_part_00
MIPGSCPATACDSARAGAELRPPPRPCRVALSRLAPGFSVRTWEIQREKSHQSRESDSPYRFAATRCIDALAVQPLLPFGHLSQQHRVRFVGVQAQLQGLWIEAALCPLLHCLRSVAGVCSSADLRQASALKRYFLRRRLSGETPVAGEKIQGKLPTLLGRHSATGRWRLGSLGLGPCIAWSAVWPV